MLLVGLPISAASAEVLLPITDTLSVGTTGYLRIGGGLALDDTDNDRRACFQAPGSGAKYRLGNECETYVELGGIILYQPDGDTGPSIRIEGMPVFAGADGDRPDYVGTRQAFIEIGGGGDFLDNAKIWFGKRYYDRHDIHINDYFWLNMSKATGGGIRDINIGLGKLDYALLRDSKGVDMNNNGLWKDAVDQEVYQTNHDFRWHDIPVNEDGKLMLWLNYAEAEDDDPVGINYDPGNGWSFGAVHKQDKFFNGFNVFSVQYGSGLNRDLSPNGLSSIQANSDDIGDAHIFRATENALIKLNDDWSAMGAIVWENKDAGDFNGTDQTWLSAAIRPYYHINDQFRTGIEVGVDYVNNKTSDVDGTLMKYTWDIEYAPERDFFSRPAVRLFVTHADWSDDWQGSVGGTSYSTDTSGTTGGIQLEYWW